MLNGCASRCLVLDSVQVQTERGWWTRVLGPSIVRREVSKYTHGPVWSVSDVLRVIAFKGMTSRDASPEIKGAAGMAWMTPSLKAFTAVWRPRGQSLYIINANDANDEESKHPLPSTKRVVQVLPSSTNVPLEPTSSPHFHCRTPGLYYCNAAENVQVQRMS